MGEAGRADERRVALVTGGARGIGRACAVALARAGHDVAVTARSAGACDEATAALEREGVRALAVSLDVRDPGSVTEALERVCVGLGPPAVLVNNAGISSSGPFERLQLDEWRAMLDVNVLGAVLVTQGCLPAMVGTGFGRIVNVASVAALEGAAYASHYAASKHALLGWSRSLALEVARRGVTVNCVCPGFVETEMTERTIARIVDTTGRDAETARRSLEVMSPQRRLMTPEEIGAAVAYLASDGARGVSGEALRVNG